MDTPRPGLPHIRDATAHDLPQIRALLYTNPQAYFFPGWDPIDHWPEHEPFIVLTRGSMVAASLAATVDNAQTAWLRLMAVQPEINVDRAWDWLWPHLYQRLRQHRVHWVLGLSLFPWLERLYRRSGFQPETQVITLEWQGQSLPAAASPPVPIRPMEEDDLPAVARVDALAFEPTWRLSLRALRRTYPYLLLSLVALAQGRVVGYITVMPTVGGAHIARLAVAPEHQGKGIGRALIQQALAQLVAQGIQRVTVNTNQENRVALHLYNRMGFRRAPLDYTVWKISLEAEPTNASRIEAARAWAPLP